MSCKPSSWDSIGSRVVARPGGRHCLSIALPAVFIPVVFASWVKMDFEASNGREVWKATGSGEPPAPPGCLNLPALFRRLFAGSR